MATALQPIRRTTASEEDQAKLRLPLTTGEEDVELPEEKPRRTKRIAALDIFRGLTVALMILVDGAGGEWPVIGHAPWNGCNLADFVMPFFLFIVGMAIPLSLKRMPNRVLAVRRVLGLSSSSGASSCKLIISSFGEIDEDNFFDPRTAQIVTVDHMKQVCTKVRPANDEELPSAYVEEFRFALDAELCKYVVDTYPKGTCAVYCTKGKDVDGPGVNFDFAVVISASRTSPQNFWCVNCFVERLF